MKNIELTSKIENDEYTNYVYSTFDIQNQEQSVTTIPFNFGDEQTFDWNIGVILGGSGSGKTTILKQLGNIKTPTFDSKKALISNFDWLSPRDASLVLTSMGLSSVPTWLRPFHTLSNGEQYRATLAYLVASAKENEVILVDEYTSVVDRDVAKAMSFALQKYIRREKKKIILSSCHYDIMEWLMPDWSYSLQKGGMFEKHDYLRQGRPKIELSVSRVEAETWNLFKKHHYLTEDINPSCKFLLFEWNKKPVGIVAIINQPRNGVSNAYSLSRTVVLPDYQGMGIGVKISEFSASIIKNQGGLVFTKTVNPALGEYRNKSVNWRPTTWNGKRKTIKSNTDKRARNRLERISYCHEYVGPSTHGFENLLLPIDVMRMQQNNNWKTFFDF